MESFISNKVKKGLPSNIHGKGLFALESIEKDEIVAIKKGHILSKEFLNQKNIGGGVGLQISDNQYIAPRSLQEFEQSMIYINYSCDPNLGMRKEDTVVAFREINPGEELTLDYAMLTNNNESFKCNCGSQNCRKNITGKDWMISELQKKYKAYFSTYIQAKIDNS